METKTMGRDWSQLKKPVSANTERTEIRRVKLNESTKLRFVGNIKPRMVRWIVTNEGGKRPLDVLSFDADTEEFTSARDPFREIPKEVYSEEPQFAYVANVIDRADGQIKLFDLKRTIYNQLLEYARDPEYGSPADEKNGYDIVIKKEKTGPLPQNVKYSLMPSRNSTPLSEEEKSLELYDLDKIFKRQTYEEQKEYLLNNTAYFSNSVDKSLSVPEGMEDL